MGEIVRYESEFGDVLVEVNDDLEHELERIDAGDKGKESFKKATASFEQAIEPVLKSSQAMLARLAELKPDKTEIQFGINLGGEIGVFAKATGEANISVTLTWESDDAEK
jgi:hypothetical protein